MGVGEGTPLHGCGGRGPLCMCMGVGEGTHVVCGVTSGLTNQ